MFAAVVFPKIVLGFDDRYNCQSKYEVIIAMTYSGLCTLKYF